MRLIDADALINALINECNNDSKKGLPVWIEKMIDAQPTVRVKQEPVTPICKSDMQFCGACRYAIPNTINYCPRCGRKVNWDASDRC